MRGLLVFVFFLFSLVSRAQQPTLNPDTSRLIIPITDTLEKNSTNSSGLDAEIHYTAEDSIKFSIDGNIIHLFGNGRISYQDMELSASYIRMDQKSKLLFASGLKNKYSVYKGRPILKQGSDAPVTSDSLVFNFETKKGKSYGTLTEVEGGFIQAKQFKKNEYNEGFFKNGIYSTCSLPEPYTHFGIHMTKGMVTDKQVISGPAYLVIEHIPLPVGIPFGFFPKTNKRASGLLFPSFGEDATQGFFMRDLGWYFGINDYWDAELRGSLYSNLSYNSNLAGRYRKNYKYNGSVNLSFASIKSSEAIEGTASARPSRSFNVQWSHSQSAEANPGTNFSANVNFGTSSYFRDTRVAGDPIKDITNNNISSSINYRKSFLDNLFNFSTSLSHRQNLTDKLISLELPTFSLGMTTLNPFQNKNNFGSPKWYEKISVGYSMQGNNSIDGVHEDVLFKKETVSKLKTGIQHAIPVSMSFNVLQYFQFSSGVNYNERWSIKQIRKRYDDNIRKVVTDTVQGFARNYDYSLNTGFSTKIYGMKNFKKGNLVALRHVMTPNFSFSYRPDFSTDRFRFYRDIDNLPTDTVLSNTRYSVFEISPGGAPGAGRSASLSFGLENNIEAKKRSKSDTTTENTIVPIIQGLSFNGSYDFAKTTFDKLSVISFSGRTAFFKQKLGISFNGSLDPYERDASNLPVAYVFKSGNLPRISTFSWGTSFSLNPSSFIKRQKELTEQQNSRSTTQQQQQNIAEILRNPNGFVDFSIPWNISASYSFYYSNSGLVRSITNTLGFNGDFSVTPKWKVTYSSGWDFKAKDLTTTTFSINRDLHCWDLAISWIPIGMYKSYSVDLRVRASILQDLKLSRRSPYQGYR